MPVGTHGAVKAMTPDMVRATGAQVVLANTYHLSLRPGEALVEKLGGREWAIRRLLEDHAIFHAGGAEVDAHELGTVRGPVEAGEELHAVLPYEQRLSWIGGAKNEQSFLLCVSRDAGETWAYVEGDVLPRDQLLALFPCFNEELDLPEPRRLPEVVRTR